MKIRKKPLKQVVILTAKHELTVYDLKKIAGLLGYILVRRV